MSEKKAAAKKADDKKAEAKPKPLDGTTKPLVEVISERLRCKLTDAERTKQLEALNDSLQEIAGLEEQKKKVASEWAEKIKERRGHLATIQETLEHGQVKPVKVEITYDFSKGRISKKRLDTGEKDPDRPMSESERQKAQGRLPMQTAAESVAKSGAKTQEPEPPKGAGAFEEGPSKD